MACYLKLDDERLESSLLKIGHNSNGRDERIRTSGLLYPKQARYQTAPRPDDDTYGQSVTRSFATMQEVFMWQIPAKTKRFA